MITPSSVSLEREEGSLCFYADLLWGTMEVSGLFRGDEKASHHLSCMCWTYFAAPQTSVISHSEILSVMVCW